MLISGGCAACAGFAGPTFLSLSSAGVPGALFCDSLICASIDSCVCFDRSPASKEPAIAVSVCVVSDGGGLVPLSKAVSTFTPRIFPLVNVKAKFMRLRSADELTQVSAFME